MYLGDKTQGHQLIYSYSQKPTLAVANPLSIEGEKFIFLPWVLSFANNNLSVLFSFEGHDQEVNKFQYIPSLLGVFLTLSICGYMVSLKRRNAQISIKVEQKTKAYYELNSDLEREIQNKENLFKQLHDSAEGLRVLTNSVNGVIWEADPKTMTYIYISDQVEKIIGYKSEDYLSGKLRFGGQKVNDGATPISELMKQNFAGKDNFVLEYQGYRKDKTLIWMRNTVSKIFHQGELVKIRGVFFDITAEKKLEKQRVLMEGQLKHAQKMEAIGQLAAGIAHEINTPAQFVGDNLSFISDSTKDSTKYHQQLEKMIHKLDDKELNEQLNKVKEQFDIAFIEDEAPLAIEQSIEGISRVSKIVSAMKDFSHPGKEDKQKIDLNRAIESTSIVARNEWKYLADLQFDFAKELPLVNCYPGEINQVILNMIVNACHAIEDATSGKSKGNILVTTMKKDQKVVIKIRDDGAGMPKNVLERIFDPFFTTKEVGQGTGQGLSLAYAVIVEKHAGHIYAESIPGSATTFTIELPLE
jgi:PAS domain S-box-containing protein